MSNPMIIMAAPNGARRQKADHPLIPLSIPEIVRVAEEVNEAGCSMLHLHIRDHKGLHSLDPDIYNEALKAIRVILKDHLILQVTTEAVGQYSKDEQVAVIKSLKPEAVSLALRELCPDDADEKDFAELNRWMQKENVFPQYILYDENDYQRFIGMRNRGLLARANPFVLFVIGRHQNDQQDQCLYEQAKKTDLPWTMCGFGAREQKIVGFAAEHSGHVRVGFENNIMHSAAVPLEDHQFMILKAQEAAQKSGRTLATADTIRKLFSL
ncbi:3-keto-5-aminohexanoate cleavage protein [Temperatibacter marinus]|uniref:3-keto-5-aminohexanoate cleavage protein n=1 Tax=Temperatibacter marinus TaxID=1456591 RepID=A0AA52H997_9PROT|nr:3-keto-5-aminohexanoate cleavage protein [Temperatibacter marinus]WND02679.1 3-keto-5-aminohexanoate cleavage protein [Temperatibacter marinus]